ncbi:MAG: PAS domain-containing protein, partial [Stellaceae bacterium]
MSADIRITRPPAGARSEIVAIYDYWRGKAPADGLLPGRRHIDPVEIPQLLPNIWLVDVVDDPRRFRVRLVGTALVDAGIPVRVGDFIVDRLLPEQRAGALAEFESVVRSREPLWYRGPVNLRHDTYVHEIERIFLPLAADGRHVDMLL